MKLSELEPKLSDTGVLRFWCPVCTGDKTHGVRVPLAPATDKDGQSWQHTGQFPDTLTLHPSINVGCWHGHIVDGEITFT